MSETQHTQGPWHWLDYPSGAKLLVAPSRAVIHMTIPTPLNVSEKDMALIAAAPELLEALERFVDVCDTESPLKFIRALGETCEQSRSAIAKATGKEDSV